MDIDRHEPGSFCWFDLGTTDQNAAKEFYSKMFGWTPDDQPMGEGQFYTMMKLRGRTAAALYQGQPGQPPAWSVYVAVTNADATAEKVTSLGGKIAVPPMDVFEAGRMAVFQDPAGAHFCIWQPKLNPGIGVYGETNAACWSELATSDIDGAKKFYGELFDWRMKTNEGGQMPYTELHVGNSEMGVGGMYPMPTFMKGVPPHWMPYFAVAAVDDFVTKATSAGAATIVPPTDIPNVGRFAVLRDPQGANFAAIQLQM